MRFSGHQFQIGGALLFLGVVIQQIPVNIADGFSVSPSITYLLWRVMHSLGYATMTLGGAFFASWLVINGKTSREEDEDEPDENS
ncbi:hypothetical protein KEM60_03353 [Austwickia sp. TVS 96-490-7B]|nr:hypothetical protein [Austwickia sp. TVS 96-490-7B]